MEGKMTVPNEHVVLISEALPLRSLGLISILNRLDDLTNPPKGSVNLHTSDEAEPGIDADANYQMLIYIAGGASDADRDNLEPIKALRALAPDVPLMILSDSETRKGIISTLNVASQGFLCVGANAELALHVFSFILNRGSHFPSVADVHSPWAVWVDCDADLGRTRLAAKTNLRLGKRPFIVPQ
jgi:DNA-binding NarL/FixJ family response regulator